MIPAAEPVVLSKNLMNEHSIPAHSVTPLPADNRAGSIEIPNATGSAARLPRICAPAGARAHRSAVRQG